MIEHKLSRRSFLAFSGASIVGGALPNQGASKQITDLLNPASPIMLPANFSPSLWFTMESNGRTNVHIFKAEIGQHVGTALAQIVAEQLCLNWTHVSIDYPEMDHNTFGKYGGQITGGSYSIHEMYGKLSKQAAFARQLLIEAGADLMGSEYEDCLAEQGHVKDTLYETEISYSEILSELVLDYAITADDLAEAIEIDRSNFKIIGKPIKALDIPEKTNGAARFGIDAYVPNMVYAKLVLPPTRFGSTIDTVDQDSAKEMPGFLAAVPLSFPPEAKSQGFITDVVAVVADSFPNALRAAKATNVSWNTDPKYLLSTGDLFENAEKQMLNEDGSDFYKIGEFDRVNSKIELESTYRTGFVAHSPMEPASALCHYIDGELHVYAGVQGGPLLPFILSQFTGLSPDKIVVYPHLIGGGFGKRFEVEPIVISAILALSLKKPVKTIFTREDEFLLSHPRSLAVQKISAKSTENGEISGLKHEICCGWIAFNDFGLVSPLENGSPISALPDVQLFSATGSDNWYDVPNQSVKMHRNKQIEEMTGNRAVRSVANNYTIFALESFIDEFAHLKRVDPVDLRLSMLKGRQMNSGKNAESLFPKGISPYVNVSTGAYQSSIDGGRRLANVLRTAAGLANYGGLLADGVAQGVAIAGAEERTNPSFSACVADVEVNAEAKFFQVNKLTVVIDLGLIVNPDGALAQVEGSVLWGLSNGLYEELTYANGKVEQTNFDTYKWQTIVGTPEINIKLLENSNYPSGAGEPATSIIAPAICNAIFAASNVRLRELPITRERFASAVAQANSGD